MTLLGVADPGDFLKVLSFVSCVSKLINGDPLSMVILGSENCSSNMSDDFGYILVDCLLNSNSLPNIFSKGSRAHSPYNYAQGLEYL